MSEDNIFHKLELYEILWRMSIWYYFSTENFDKKLNSYLSENGSYIPIDAESRKKSNEYAIKCRDVFRVVLRQLVQNPRDYGLDKRAARYHYEKLSNLYFNYVAGTEIEETLDQIKNPKSPTHKEFSTFPDSEEKKDNE